jgi:hypothetical protein
MPQEVLVDGRADTLMWQEVEVAVPEATHLWEQNTVRTDRLAVPRGRARKFTAMRVHVHVMRARCSGGCGEGPAEVAAAA